MAWKEHIRSTWDIRTVGCNSHGTLQVEEVWTASGDNEGGVVEFPTQGLQLPQGVRRPRTEVFDRLHVLVTFRRAEANKPRNEIPDTPGESRRSAPPLVLLQCPE